MKGEKTSPQGLARLTGLLYLLMGVVGAFGMVYLPATLELFGDSATAIENIIANENLFRIGILANILTQVIQVFLILALYRLLRPAGRNLAWLMMVFILLGVPIAIFNEVNNFAILFLLNQGEAVFAPEQVQSLIGLFSQMHSSGILVAHTFWGLWLFPMGYLVFKSGYIPKIIGVFLMIGCVGYLIDLGIFTLYPDMEFTISQYTFIGELLLPIWLLIRGVNVEAWREWDYQAT